MANKIEIVITADNRTGQAINGVNKSLGGLGKVAGGATGAIGSFGSALGGMAVVAGGIIAANIFGKIVSGVGAFVSTGLEAVGSAQQLETSLKALLTANNMYEQSTQQVTQAVVKQVMSQGELAIKSEELSAKLAVQRASFNEQSERIRQLTIKYGENGLAVIKARAQHDKLGLAIQKTERDIANLSTTETSYTTVTKQVFNQTMDQAEAFKIASQQTKELMKFVSQVAVISPFETETVEMTTKYAVAAGLGVEQTKQFVPAFLDLAAAVGISSSELGFAADQLFQVRKIGKLTQIDLRQLRRLGIDLGKIIGVEMGMSIEEFNAAAENSPEIFDELFDAVTRFSQNTFAGTSQEMAQSVKGLKSTLSDIFVIGARNFWEPLVDAVTPMVSEILGKLSDFVLGGDVASLGQKLANSLLGGLSTAKGLFNIAKVLGLEAAIRVVIQMIQNAWPDIWNALMTWAVNFWNWVTDTVIPAAVTTFNVLAEIIGEIIADKWPTVQAKLFEWRDKFFDWVNELYPQIPAIMTGIVTAIAGFLAANWPMIADQMMTWTTRFWDWAKEAAAGAAEAMNRLAVAMIAWATSDEAQTALNSLGQQIGMVIVDEMNRFMVSSDGASNVLVSLAQALAVGVASIAGTLIIAGGQIVAGILQGILQSIGIDLEPALFSELSGILAGIGQNLVIIAQVVGANIVEAIVQGVANLGSEIKQIGVDILIGISEGIINGINTLITTLNQIGFIIVHTVQEILGISSPSTVFFSIGVSILQGLIDGLRSIDLGGILGEVFGGVTEFVSGLFGGGEGEDAGSFLAFDATAIIAGLQTVQVFLTETIPQGVMMLMEQFSLFLTMTTEQLTMLTTGPLTLLIESIASIYLVHTPTLSAAWMALVALMVAQIGVTIAAVGQLIASLVETQNTATRMSNKIVSGMKKAADSIKDKLIPAVKQATTAFRKLEEAARAAAAAARDAGNASGDSGGTRFQHGTPPGGFTVPPGFPNDSFLARFTSGERIFAFPQGQPVDLPGRQSNTTNNYYFQQTVNTRADASTVIGDFKTMQLLLGV